MVAVWLPQPHFRGNVRGSPHAFVLGILWSRYGASKSKITQLDPVTLKVEDVLRLDISVEQSTRVHMPQGVHQLHSHSMHLIEG